MRFDTKLKYETSHGFDAVYIGEHPKRSDCKHIFAVGPNTDVFFVDDNGESEYFDWTVREKKKKIVQLANVYRDSSGKMHMGTLHDSKFDCDFYGDIKSRIACVKIEFEEGEGL